MSKAPSSAPRTKGPSAPTKPAPKAPATAKEEQIETVSVDTKSLDVTKLSRAEIAEKYLPYVRSIAGKIKKSISKEIDFDDLVEYGMIGLLEAADRYDAKFGANFMTFAYYRIRGAIYDGLRGMGWMSRTEYAKARFEERANEYLAQVAIAEESDAAPPENPFEHAVSDLANAVQGLAAVYITTLDGAEGAQLQDMQTPAPDEKLGLDQARELVRLTINRLAGQERELLEMYYYQDLSLQEVGDKLGLSKSWTSRLHARVIDKLHRLLVGQLGP